MPQQASSFPCPQLLPGSQGLQTDHLLTPHCEPAPHLLDPTLGTSSSRQPYYTVFPPPQKFFLVLKDSPKKRTYMYFHLFQGMEQTHPQAGEGERQMDTKLERISYSEDGTNKVLRLRM